MLSFYFNSCEDFILISLLISSFNIGYSVACCLISAAAAKSLQSCPTLCDPIDGSPSGSPIPGILQARLYIFVNFLVFCLQLNFSFILLWSERMPDTVSIFLNA